jgi:ATP-dependent Lon protease
LKEKLLAAKQAGVKTILIPAKNVKDLADIPEEIQNGLEIHPCEHVEQVLKVALDLTNPEKFLQPISPTLTVVDGARSLEVAN